MPTKRDGLSEGRESVTVLFKLDHHQYRRTVWVTD
jgi:hypothetical protein